MTGRIPTDFIPTTSTTEAIEVINAELSGQVDQGRAFRIRHRRYAPFMSGRYVLRSARGASAISRASMTYLKCLLSITPNFDAI